jgi:hypothetical protein
MLIWPRQLALSRFYIAAALEQKMRAFDPKKEAGTFKTNFDYWKLFLTYYYRVAYRGSHFSTADDDQQILESCIQFIDA